ncbi:hypothetical protein MNEG_11669, partial [Monoraphidium neglectum]
MGPSTVPPHQSEEGEPALKAEPVVFQPPGEAIVVEEDVKQPLNSHNEDAGLLPALMATPPRMPRRG